MKTRTATANKKTTKPKTKKAAASNVAPPTGSPSAPVAATQEEKKGSASSRPAQRKAIQPYDDEAMRYMYNPSIPGAYAPIYYTGEKVSIEIARILGRSMTLEEGRYLVQPDGDIVTCTSDGIEFQPVKYVPFIPDNLAAAIAAGKKLTTTNLYWGGAFYVNKDNEMIALSGSVYHYSNEKRRFEYVNASPLVKMASALEKIHGRKVWGKPLEDIRRVIQSRRESIEREQRIAGIADNVYVPGRHRNGDVSVANAFNSAKPDRRGRNNGRGEPYKRNRQADLQPEE